MKGLSKYILVFLLAVTLSACVGGSESGSGGGTTPPATANTPVPFTVMGYDASFNMIPIQGAVVRVDQIDYTTGINGEVLITGADVGLHDIHVFASGYDWVSLYQVTADSTANIFTLDSVRTDFATYYDSQLTITLNVPAGYVAPTVGKLETVLTDAYGNVFKGYTYVHSYINDPYTGAQTPVYQAYIQTSKVPAFVPFTGTLAVSEVRCDANGFNCTSLSFTDNIQQFTPEGRATYGTPTATVTLTANLTAIATPVANTTSSQVVMGLNMSNTLLTVGAAYDIYAQKTFVSAVFSVADVYGNITDYKGSVNTKVSYVTFPATITSTVSAVTFENIPIGSVLTGNLSVIERKGSYISNFIDLGQVTLTTTQAPYVVAFNNPPPSVNLAVAFPVVPAYPVADNTSMTSSIVDIAATVQNSIYHDPYALVSNNGYAMMNISLSTVDVYGYAKSYNGYVSMTRTYTYDAYGSFIGLKNSADTVGQIIFYDLPPGSIITGNLIATEIYFDYTTNIRSQVQYLDLGLTTFTTSQLKPTWKGFNIPAVISASVNINFVFPLTPPTPTSVLSLNSSTLPLGMSLNDVSLNNDTFSYYADVNDRSSPITLPHNFTNLTPVTGALEMSVSASDFYTQASYSSHGNYAVGSVVDMVASLTAIPSIAANQFGSTIQVNPSANTKTFVSVNISGTLNKMLWSVFVPTSVTSVILPTPPASIINPWVVGATYDVSMTDYKLRVTTYSQFTTAYMGQGAAWGAIISGDHESITSPPVPYIY